MIMYTHVNIWYEILFQNDNISAGILSLFTLHMFTVAFAWNSSRQVMLLCIPRNVIIFYEQLAIICEFVWLINSTIKDS